MIGWSWPKAEISSSGCRTEEQLMRPSQPSLPNPRVPLDKTRKAMFMEPEVFWYRTVIFRTTRLAQNRKAVPCFTVASCAPKVQGLERYTVNGRATSRCSGKTARDDQTQNNLAYDFPVTYSYVCTDSVLAIVYEVFVLPSIRNSVPLIRWRNS